MKIYEPKQGFASMSFCTIWKPNLRLHLKPFFSYHIISLPFFILVAL
jgi:hypothetical protein